MLTHAMGLNEWGMGDIGFTWHGHPPTEGDEVESFGLLEAFEACGRGGIGSLHPTLRKKREGWGTRDLSF